MLSHFIREYAELEPLLSTTSPLRCQRDPTTKLYKVHGAFWGKQPKAKNLLRIWV